MENNQDFLHQNGIYTLPLEIPFPVGPVNCTIIDGDPPAIVDPGMNYRQTIEIIREKFKDFTGKSLENLGEIYLTHPHLDHFGTAGKLKDITGAQIHTLELSKHRFENYLEYWSRDREYYIRCLELSKAPPEKIRESREYRSNFHSYATHPQIDRPLTPRREFTIAGRLRAIPLHLPGHTPWCSALWLPELSLMIAGDLFVYRTTSASLIYPPESAPDQWMGVHAYLNSLRQLEDLPLQTIIPGHGPIVPDGPRLVKKALQKREKKLEQLENILQKYGPLTVFQAAQQLYGPEFTDKNFYLTFNETTQYLKCLQRRGKVKNYTRQNTLFWELTDSAG